MYYSLLPQEYKKEVRREKVLRSIVVMFGILNTALLVGIVFLLPSYFMPTFSQGEAERQFRAQQELLARQNVQELEDTIRQTNALTALYQRNESRRKSVAPLLLRFAALDIPDIALRAMHLFEDKTGAFAVSLQGNATTRNTFLAYVRSLENTDGVAAVRSPVDNLLREADVSFSLEVALNKEFYSYVTGP